MLRTALHAGKGWQGSSLKETRIWESELQSLSLGQVEPKKIMTRLGEDVEKLEPSYTAGGNVHDEAILEEFGSSLKNPT